MAKARVECVPQVGFANRGPAICEHGVHTDGLHRAESDFIAMDPIEFLVLKRPVSCQTKSRNHLQEWKNLVLQEATKAWPAGTAPEAVTPIRFSIVYLCDEEPPDVDNIIKPIQDALVGLVFEDDSLITDVDGHRRFLSEIDDVSRLPARLQAPILAKQECIYVRVSQAQDLERYL